MKSKKLFFTAFVLIVGIPAGAMAWSLYRYINPRPYFYTIDATAPLTEDLAIEFIHRNETGLSGQLGTATERSHLRSLATGGDIGRINCRLTHILSEQSVTAVPPIARPKAGSWICLRGLFKIQ